MCHDGRSWQIEAAIMVLKHSVLVLTLMHFCLVPIMFTSDFYGSLWVVLLVLDCILIVAAASMTSMVIDCYIRVFVFGKKVEKGIFWI